MKKIFSILAAAVIALSFASCEKSDLGAKYFKIKVTDITDSSAVVSITPTDTAMIYGIGMYYTSAIKEYTLDTIVAYAAEEFQYYVDNYGVSLEDLVSYDYLYQGPVGPEEVSFPANSAITIIAYEVLLSEDSVISIGRVASKNFSTKKVPVVGNEDLGVLENSYFEDYRDWDGSFYVEGWNLDEAGENYTAYVGLCIFDEDFVGTFNFDDFDSDPDYSYVYTPEAGLVGLGDAKVKGTVNGETAKLEGWVVGTNVIKYSFSVEYVPEEEGEPAPARRVAAKKEVAKEAIVLEKQKLAVKKFVKK